MASQRPRWNGHAGQPGWVGAILGHQGRLIDYLVEHLGSRIDSLDQRMEHLVSSFDDLVAVDQQLADGVQRIATDFDNLKATLGTTNLSADDQAKLDAAVSQLQSSVDKISTSDPAQTAPPVSDPGNPTNPPADSGATAPADGSTPSV